MMKNALCSRKVSPRVGPRTVISAYAARTHFLYTGLDRPKKIKVLYNATLPFTQLMLTHVQC
jgi:hypothetical protein